MAELRTLEPPQRAVSDRRWTALAVVAIVQFLIIIDNTVVNVALPTIQRSLGFTTDGLAWVVNGYLLTAGGLLLLGGRLGDLFGRVRMFCLGATLFGLASLLAGAAPTAEILVAARFAQGVGEALASPAALSLIAVLFANPGERAKAFGIWGGLAGLGAVTGVLLSGVLTDLASWRWNFYINVPLAAAAVLLLPRLVHEEAARRRPVRANVVSAVLVTTALTSLVYGLLNTHRHGWGSAQVLVPFAVTAVTLVGFAVAERASRDPLVPLRFFADRTRVTANVASLFFMSNLAAVFLLLTLYMQNVMGYSALRTGLAYVPFCVAFVAAILATIPVAARIGARATLIVAFGVGGLGMALLAFLDLDGAYHRGLLPALLVLAVGFGAGFPTLQAAALHALPEADAGLGSGVQTSVQSLANALGVAIFLTIALGHGAAGIGGAAGGSGDGYRFAFGVGVLTMGIGGVLVAVLMPRQPSPSVGPGHR